MKTPENLLRWRGLLLGQPVVVVKLDPQGVEAARYSAVVVDHAADDWLALRAIWTHHLIEIDGLRFFPGDVLIEWFSPHLPFNAFGVLDPAGALRGWYANVTRPACLEADPENAGTSILVWHDLYLDVIGLPDGSSVVRDEDELAASGLESRDPQLHAEIPSLRAGASGFRWRRRIGREPGRSPQRAGRLVPVGTARSLCAGLHDEPRLLSAYQSLGCGPGSHAR